MVNQYTFISTDPDVCPEPMISRTKRLFLSADPDEVSQGFLAQIWGQRAKEPAALFSLYIAGHMLRTSNFPKFPNLYLEHKKHPTKNITDVF